MSAYTMALAAFRNEVIDGSGAPDMTRDADEIEKNTADLGASLNNTQIDVFFIWY